MRKIKKGDEIIVITGKDKGKRGQVLTVIGEEKILVANLNLAKKHTKPDPNKGVSGGIVEKEMPLDISNVAVFNTTTKRADRIGFRILDDGKKIRVFKSTNEAVDA